MQMRVESMDAVERIGVSRRDLIGRRVGQSPVAGDLQGSRARGLPEVCPLTGWHQTGLGPHLRLQSSVLASAPNVR